MDGDKKQLLLNINGEPEIVVTRKRSRKTLWALVIVTLLFATIAIGGVYVVHKIVLEYPDGELSFFTATINGKVEKITVNADKNWVEYHVLGDVITKQPEVLTVHDFHENLHVIKVIDVENSNRSKCFVGTLDRQKSPSPSDIMQFATDNSNEDKIPMSMELHYEGYDWLDVEPSLLGPVYHRLCHGVETAFIFPLNDDDYDQDLMIDELKGHSSLSASPMIEESSPVLYSFSYTIDHHQEDAQRMVRFKREEPTPTSPDTRPALNRQFESSRLVICSTYCPRPRRRGQQTDSNPAARSKRSAQPNYDYSESPDEDPEETDQVDVPAPDQSSQQGGAERSRTGIGPRYLRGRRDVDETLSRVRSKRSAQPNYDYYPDDDSDETGETDQVDVPAPDQSSQQGGAERSCRVCTMTRYARGRRDVNDVLGQFRSKRAASAGRPNNALRILSSGQDTAVERTKRDVSDGDDEGNDSTATPLTLTNRGVARSRGTVGRRVYGPRQRQRRQVDLTTTTAQTIVETESTSKRPSVKSGRSRAGAVARALALRTPRPRLAPPNTA